MRTCISSPSNVPLSQKRGIKKILHFLFSHPDDHRSSWGPGWNLLLNFGTWERLGSVTSLWFVNGCQGNSTENNNACVLVFIYLLPSYENNVSPPSNPHLVSVPCSDMGWRHLCVTDTLWQSKPSKLLCSAVTRLRDFRVSFCHGKRKHHQTGPGKKKPDKNGLSVQLAIDFPAGL